MSNHVAVWPKVRVTANGKTKIIERGETVPDGVSAVDLDNLVTFGAIAGVSGSSAAVVVVEPVDPVEMVVVDEPIEPVPAEPAPSVGSRGKRTGA